VEVQLFLYGEIVHDYCAGVWVLDTRHELVGVATVTLGKVEESCVDFGGNGHVNYLGVVVLYLSLLSDFFDHVLEGFQLIRYLTYGLLFAKSFSVDHDEIGSLLVDGYVVFGPVDEHLFEVLLGDGLFGFVASFAVGEDLGEVVVEGSCEGEGKPFLSFRDSEGSIHGFLFRGISSLIRNNFPGSSAYFLVHLNNDFGGC
jgi:hypothetical protein